MKAKIVRLLRERNGYVSGQELCERLQVSRTAVWKVVNQLKEAGYVIDAQQNKGYRLLESPDIMEEYELESRIHTRWAGRNISFRKVTGSTNIDCKQLAEAGAPHGMLAVADAQESGRGRRGKSWQSPAGCSIFMSLLCRPDFSPDKASMLTLVMGLSVAEAVRKYTGLDAKIKWPNDVVINGRKVCGILTEMELSVETNDIQYVVIGTGINVNNGYEEMKRLGDREKAREAFSPEIRDMATSLFLERGGSVERVCRAELTGYVMEAFEKHYETFLKTLDFSLLKENYNNCLVNRDVTVKVLDPKGEYQGTARGIDSLGDLLVELDNGEVKRVYAGEVSVRGLYGYTA